MGFQNVERPGGHLRRARHAGRPAGLDQADRRPSSIPAPNSGTVDVRVAPELLRRDLHGADRRQPRLQVDPAAWTSRRCCTITGLTNATINGFQVLSAVTTDGGVTYLPLTLLDDDGKQILRGGSEVVLSLSDLPTGAHRGRPVGGGDRPRSAPRASATCSARTCYQLGVVTITSTRARSSRSTAPATTLRRHLRRRRRDRAPDRPGRERDDRRQRAQQPQLGRRGLRAGDRRGTVNDGSITDLDPEFALGGVGPRLARAGRRARAGQAAPTASTATGSPACAGPARSR